MTDKYLDDLDAAADLNAETERREEQDKKHSDNYVRSNPKSEREKPKKIINFLMVEEDIWNILVDRANKVGQSLAQYCADALTTITENIEGLESERSFKLALLRRRSRKYFESITTLEMVAAEYNSKPSSELADVLMALCEELGKDPEEIKRQAKNDPMSEEIANFKADPLTKMARCRKWMIEFMRSNNYRVAAKTGNDIGGAMFHKDMIAQVRRKLGVQSIQEKDGVFYWTVTTSDRAAKAILDGGDDEWEK